MSDYFTHDPNSAAQERYRHESRRHGKQVEAGTQSELPGPKLPDSPPFRYKFKPNRYAVVAGKVVPYLSKATLADGVNGAVVDERSKRLQVGSFRSNHSRGGGLLIPLDAIPPEHEQITGTRSYLCTVEDRPHLHISIYERVFPGSDAIEPDMESYLAFCEYLMAEGIVPRPGLHVCRQRAEEARARGRQAEAAAWEAEAKRVEDEVRGGASERDRREEPPKPARRRAVARDEGGV